MSEADRYVENCSLFTTEPVAAFENALKTGALSCSLAGAGVDDNGMVGNHRNVLTSWCKAQAFVALFR
jgi:shikimate kinase